MRNSALRHWFAGQWASLIGSLTILLGVLIHSRTLLVRGHRQRVIGVLQQSCAVDRHTVDAFIDRWLSRHDAVPYAAR